MSPPRVAGGLAIAALFAAANPALGYCRTKACDTKPSYGDVWDTVPDPAECVRTPKGCTLQGTPLYWPSNCISFGIQKDGSANSGIDFETARTVVANAFDTWNAAECLDPESGEVLGSPSFSVVDRGSIECERPEYNQDQENANVILFRDSNWPYGSQSGDGILALTTITYNVENAQIYDADIEFNSNQARFSTTDIPEGNAADLLSVATHEIGHFLGLSHSSVDSAVMRGIGYEPGTDELRVLHTDDVAGICEIYPPGARLGSDCEPRHGFSRECAGPVDEGCAVRRPKPGKLDRELAGLALLFFAATGRRLTARRRPGLAARAPQRG